MPAFSFTAPHVTAEQEREEIESLSDERRQEIHNDLYGTAQEQFDQEETRGQSDQILTELDEAIHKLPMQQTMDYFEAKRHAPKLLFQTESDPMMFLRCENFNCEAAATRLAYYWKIRRKIFGEDQAYLPMTLSDALADDLPLFETGFIAVHPRDERGRTVLFFDRIRAVPPLASRDATLRCLFFMVHCLAFEEISSQIGCVCLVNIKVWRQLDYFQDGEPRNFLTSKYPHCTQGYDVYRHFDRLLSKFLSAILLHCMPIKIKALHLFVGSANGVMSLVLPSMKQVMGKECRLRMVVHSGLDCKMLESLGSYGLTRNNLNEALSGNFRHRDFVSWLDHRRKKEELRRDSMTSMALEESSENA